MAGHFKVRGGPMPDEAHVVKQAGLNPGLMAYTHPIDTYEWTSDLLTNTTYGIAANINPAGSPVLTLIHNGGDTVAWTAANVTGSDFIFASTDQAQDGTQSIDATGTSNNDIAGFTAPAPLNPQNFSGLRLYIFIEGFDQKDDKDIRISWDSAGAPVGNDVSIKPYCDTTLQDVWQLVDIPLSDFGLSAVASIDELQIKTIDTGKGAAPNYYLDAISLVSAASGLDVERFTFEPEYGSEYNLKALTLRAYNTGSSNLDPTQFFGLPALSNGCVLNFRDKERVFTSLIFRDVWDMLRIGSSSGEVLAGNGSGATFAVRFDIPSDQLKIDGSKNQYIELIVRDDLTGLGRFMVTLDLEKYVGE